MGRLPLPPAASAVHSRRGRRPSGPHPRGLNPPPSCGHFAKDVTGPLHSSCARLAGDRPKRYVRRGAAASVGMRPFSGPAASRMACGRSGVGTRRRIGRNVRNPTGERLLLPSSTRGRRTPSRRAPNVISSSGEDVAGAAVSDVDHRNRSALDLHPNHRVPAAGGSRGGILAPCGGNPVALQTRLNASHRRTWFTTIGLNAERR
jgi:hypothetical protein